MTMPSHEENPQPTPHAARTKLVVPILVTCLVILAGIYSPWILFVSFALLPTLLIRMIDKSKKRLLTFSVTGLNITGLMLALQHSYNAYGSSPQPGMLFQDWVNWVFPFGLAWVGALFFMAFPIAFASVMEIILQRREQRLKDKQKMLLEVWGTQLRQKTTNDNTQDDPDLEKKSGEKKGDNKKV